MIDRMLSPDRAQRLADLREVGALPRALRGRRPPPLRALGGAQGAGERLAVPSAGASDPLVQSARLSGSLAPDARISDAFPASTADLDGEASIATLRTAGLCQRALELRPRARAERPPWRRRPTPPGAPRGGGRRRRRASPKRERSPVGTARRAKRAGLKLVAAGVLLAAGAGSRCFAAPPRQRRSRPTTAPSRQRRALHRTMSDLVNSGSAGEPLRRRPNEPVSSSP